MNRKIDICEICGAMQLIQTGAVSTVYACEDAGTHHIAGIKIYNSICIEEQWSRQEVPVQCRYYAEYFLADCNKNEVDG